MRDFELVIFDCDGVVVDSEVLSCRCLAEVLGRHGVPVGLEEVFDRFLGRSFAAVEEHFLKIRGVPAPDQFRADLNAHLAAAFRASLRPMPHVEAVLAGLDKPYCLASSSHAERIRLTLAVTGLAHHFGGRVFDAAMVARGKPAPDLFLHVADKMGARAALTLVIEDSVTGVQAGKAAGMTVWGFTGGSHYADRDAGAALAAAGADRVFGSMTEFTAY